MQRSRLVLLTMCVGYFLVLLDVTAVNVALPSIGAGLDAGVGWLQWVVDGYAVTLAALLLPSGVAGDRFGHRRVVLVGMALFALASAACAAAPTTLVLVTARITQGAGAALLLPGTLAIIGRAHPEPAARARAVGVWAAVGSIALAGGPVLGGLVVSSVGWRVVFAVNVPVVLVAAAVTWRRIDDDRPDGLPDPLFPWRLLRRPAFATANAVAGAMNLGTLGLLFVLTLFLQDVQGRSALSAGLATLPMSLPLCLLSPLTGRAVGRVGARPPMVAGLVLMAAGAASLVSWAASSSYAVLFPGLLAWGLGLAMLTPSVVAAALAAAPSERAGFASGLNNTARQAGGALGVAAYGTVVGPPHAIGAFLAGVHEVALATAALWVACALLVSAWSRSAWTRPGRPSPRRW